MRITVTLDDAIAETLREQARIQGSTFKQIVNETLRRGLATAGHEDRPVFRVKPLPGGFLPGIDPLKLNQLNDELMVQEFLEKNARIEKAAGIQKDSA